MDETLSTSFAAWDRQERRRMLELTRTENYVGLNNLYLQIQRGAAPLTVFNANALRVMAGRAYANDDPMGEWWMNEFTRLPGWNAV